MRRAARPITIKAVTLDCWGTLLLDGPGSDDNYKRARLLAIEKILESAGCPVAPAALDQAYFDSGRRLAHIWRTRRDVPVTEHVNALLQAVDADLPERLPVSAMRDLVEAYANPALRVPPPIDDGAPAALDDLATRGLVLAMISNTMRTPGFVFRRIFEQAGLLAPFRVLTFSDECGIRKPDPEIFLLTLRQVGIEPEYAVHIGDDPVLDVEGARDAGLGGVIQVAARGRATGPVKPDAVITRLAELPAAIDRLTAP